MTFPSAIELAGSTPRLSGLDGLRAIAVGAVIAYHFVPFALPAGYVGVDVFFVISGFLITGIFMRERNLARFWMRRARRLLPALVVVVVVCCTAAFFIGGDVLVGLGAQVLGAATFCSNWTLIAGGTDYFSSGTPELFRNLWSLAVEEQFYLVWPLVLVVVSLIPSRWVRLGSMLAAGAASAVAMVVLSASDPDRGYFGTDTHSFGLAIGAALAVALGDRFDRDVIRPPGRARMLWPVAGAASVLGILAIAYLLPAQWAPNGGLLAVALLTAIAIIGATGSDSWLGRALDVAPIRWVGARSYGLYLWHWPVLVLLAAALPVAAPEWIAPAAGLILTVGAAALSYRFVELPLHRRGLSRAGRVAQLKRPVVRIAVCAVALSFAASVVLTSAAIARDPGQTEAEALVEQGAQSLAADRSDSESDVPNQVATGDQITAIGDSVMLAAAPELEAAFPGITIDAVVSRQMWEAEDIIADLVAADALRPVLVLGLGTNGWIESDTLQRIYRLVGRSAQIVVVNVQAPREWVPDVNAKLAQFCGSHRDVELSNWFDAIQPHLDVLAEDEVHPGPTGGEIYVGSLSDALQRLADLPPPRNPNDLPLIDKPV